MARKENKPVRFSATVVAAIVLVAFLILAMTGANGSGRQTQASQNKSVDEDAQLELVPLVGNARIEIGLAPVYETKGPMVSSTTKLERVESPSNAELVFGSGGKIEGLPYYNKSGIYRAMEETRTEGLPGGASVYCKQNHKYVLEAKVVGGTVVRKKRAVLLSTIELEVRDFDAENTKTCEVTPPGITMPSETEYDDGQKAKWWRTALYNWPYEDGHSEVVGRFQYTLHIGIKRDCDPELSRSMDEARERFQNSVKNCVENSGVITQCDTDMLGRCVLYIFSGDSDTSIINDCIESACGVWEEGLTQCLRTSMSLYMSRLIEIEKQYKECMGK